MPGWNRSRSLISDGSGNAVTDLGRTFSRLSSRLQARRPSPRLRAGLRHGRGIGHARRLPRALIPTLPGDYTFHLTGTVHGQPVDETATSSDSTFDSVQEPTAIQFPNQVPSGADLATRIQSVDSRVDSAQSQASSAMLVGGAVGIVGIVIALIALFVAWRARPPRVA